MCCTEDMSCQVILLFIVHSSQFAHSRRVISILQCPYCRFQIHELTKQQIATIEQVVPWFLNTMPPAYFRQVPESFRLDHIKAVSAVRDANMDLYLNLQSHLPDGRLVLTFIRPGTQPGLLLQMVKDLPWNHFQGGDEYLPLTRVQVFSALDESMSLNLFVYGDEPNEPFDVTVAGARILDYADAALTSDAPDEIPEDICEREGLIEYMKKCSENYITRSDPRRYLQQRMLFERVSRTEGTAVHVEVRNHFAFAACLNALRLGIALHCLTSCVYIYLSSLLYPFIPAYHYHYKAITRR